MIGWLIGRIRRLRIAPEQRQALEARLDEALAERRARRAAHSARARKGAQTRARDAIARDPLMQARRVPATTESAVA